MTEKNIQSLLLRKSYATFRSRVSRTQWLCATLFAAILGFAGYHELPVAFFFAAVLVFIAGCLGGSFSLLREFRKECDRDGIPYEMTDAGVVSNVVTGGVIALVFLLLLSAGVIGRDDALLSIAALPELKISDVGVNGSPEAPLDVKSLFTVGAFTFEQFSLLIFWGFLAGYSEGIVFGVLDRFRKKAGDNVS